MTWRRRRRAAGASAPFASGRDDDLRSITHMQQHDQRSRRTGTAIGRRAVVRGATGRPPAPALPARGAGKPALSVAVGVDVITLDPDRIPGGNEYLFMANVFEGLFGHDETGKVTPLLAESVAPSADG